MPNPLKNLGRLKVSVNNYIVNFRKKIFRVSFIFDDLVFSASIPSAESLECMISGSKGSSLVELGGTPAQKISKGIIL